MRFLILAVFLTACSTAPVFLKHPETGVVVQCGPYDNRGLQSAASAIRESKCIDDFKEQGYIRQ